MRIPPTPRALDATRAAPGLESRDRRRRLSRMRRALALAVVLALGISSTASAKGPISAKACGSSGCETTKFHEPFVRHLQIPPVLMRGGADPPPRIAGPWFDVRFRLVDLSGVDDRCQSSSPPRFCDPTRRVLVLADGSYVGGRDPRAGRLVWHRLNPAQAGVYARLTRGLEPLPSTSLLGDDTQAPTPAADDSVWPWVAGGGIVLIVLAGAGVAMHRWRSRSDIGAARPQE